MHCNIKWKELTICEWAPRFSRARRANLLQFYGYAQAVCPLKQQKARWGIIEIDGQEAGLVQVLEASAFANLLHAVILDRGPIWFEGFGNAAHIMAFFAAFHRQFPRRIGRKRRVIPDTATDITPCGFHKTGVGYETMWLDLRPDIDALRAGLKKNWRGSLQKAEKAGLDIIWDDKGQYLAWCLSGYMQDRAAKGYDGPSVELLKALARTCPFLIGRVEWQGKPIAGILIFKHGAGATYQLGFSSNAGRDKGAHHIILWQAMIRLKHDGILDFDLGGINDDTAKNVRRFKDGLGGDVAVSCGLYQ